MRNTRSWAWLFVLLCLVPAGSGRPGAAQSAASGDAPALSVLFGPGGIVRDTNADGLADAVAARVVVPSSPTVREIQAATNLAARLAFETTALTLPIVVRDTANQRLGQQRVGLADLRAPGVQ